MKPQHLRQQDYRSMPWRNGAGVTLEIARDPATGPEFDWRLSLATVAQSGPFSDFQGYRRSVTLLSGAGFRLDIAGLGRSELARVGATTMFSGGASALCTLVDGPCRDLSLMVREPGDIEIGNLALGSEPLSLRADGERHLALFCVEGAATVDRCGDHSGPSGSGRTPGSPAFEVHRDDTLLLGEDTEPWSVQAMPRDTSAQLLLLRWRASSASGR